MRRFPASGPTAGYAPHVLRVSTATRLRSALGVIVPLVVAALLVPWLLVDAADRARLRTDAELRADVAAAVSQVGAALRDQVSQAGLTSGISGTTVAARAVESSTVSLASAIEARDSGAPALDDGSVPASIVVPVYGQGPPPRTTAARRQGITAYRVVPVSVRQVLAPLVPDHGGLVVHGPTRVVAAEPGARPGGSRSFSVPLDLAGTPGWTLQGWQPTAGVPAATWLLLLALLALLGGVSAVLVVYQRHADEARAKRDQLARHNDLVSGLAPVVQASLDLAEVVPASSAHLAQGLNLSGLSLSAPGPGGERPLFSWGEPPDVSVLPRATRPEGLGAGETFALSLARGGRVMGVLRVTARTPLTSTDLAALATASELVGSTLANADAFAQQQSLLDRMQSLDELKTVFLATASHELRTPVAAIVGFSTLVLQQWGQGDPEHTKAYLERVLSNARALEALTEQLLDFSRLERGVRPQAGELLDLGQTTSTVLAGHPELVTGHDLRLDLAKGCLMRGSGPAVERIITNLVGNAAKYSPAGTVITVSVHADAGQVALVVDDEGPGVPVAERARIFTRFYRGRDDTTATTRGAGVGLAIVAEFAASMSGTASVQQAPSGGARFSVSFPAAGLPAQTDGEGAPHVRLA
jgi:signal transduction histidine kinase